MRGAGDRDVGDVEIHVQNERIVLSWFSAACFIILIGVSLLALHPPDGHLIIKGWPPTAIFGVMVVIYTFLVIIYAAWQYSRRLDAFARNLHESEFQYYESPRPRGARPRLHTPDDHRSCTGRG